MTTMNGPPTHDAANVAFNYYGRWRAGSTAASINSGSLVEFAYTGHACELLFDVGGFTQYPAIFVQVDEGPVLKTTLSAALTSVAIHPPYNGVYDEKAPLAGGCSACHVVRWWVGAHSLYLMSAQGRQWATLDGGCRFRGVRLGAGGELLPLPRVTRQIEFLGDSITQGLRLLYNGADDDTGQQIPYANWTQVVADLLAMRPIVTGFGGQGITTAGTSGAPPAEFAFPFAFQDAPWVPAIQPEAVVIYQGTNDPVDAGVFRVGYERFLRTVRGARPAAWIFGVCPHLQGRYAEAIGKSVVALGDRRAQFLNYSDGVIARGDTSDGCHLNPGGATRLAVRLAGDLERMRS